MKYVKQDLKKTEKRCKDLWVRFHSDRPEEGIVIGKVYHVTVNDDFEGDDGVFLHTESGTLQPRDILEKRSICTFDRPSLESCEFDEAKFIKDLQRWVGRWVRSYRGGVLCISQVEMVDKEEHCDTVKLYTEKGPVDPEDVLEVR